MRISNLNAGDVYAPITEAPISIRLHVGVGGDCGVYLVKGDNEEFLFRVLVNTVSIKKDWKRVGRDDPVKPELRDYLWYGETDVGTDNYYQTRLDDVEHRISVDKDAYEKLERLGSYSTRNILDRVSATKLPK